MSVRVENRRGKRTLVIDFRYIDAAGKPARYRHDAAVQTRAAAVAEERRLLVTLTTTGAPVQVPVVVVPSVPVIIVPTFGETARCYLESYAPSKLKASTMAGYRALLAGFLLPRIGDLCIDAIDAAVVRRLDAEMVGRGLKAGTRRQAAIVVRSILSRYAVEAGLLATAPVLPSMPRQGAKLPATMTSAEFDAVLAASLPEHRLAFIVAADAGLRAGEVRGLRWCDVDMEQAHLTVRVAICRGVAGPPKSGSERVVPLSARLLTALRAVVPGKPGDRVCRTKYGEPWKEYGLSQAWRRTCDRAEVKRWRLHDLRHLFVSELFRGGTGAPTVQALAGHASLATTSRYSHSTRADMVAAIARLGQRGGNGHDRGNEPGEDGDT